MFSLKLYAIILAIFPIYGIQSQFVTTPNNVTYYLNTAPGYTWYDAYLECSYRGLALLTVDSKEQYDDILALLKDNANMHLWVGAIGNGNEFAWLSTGNSIKPNLLSTEYKSGESSLKCVKLWENYGLKNLDCKTTLGYLCEKRVQPGDCCADESNVRLYVTQSNTCTK